ncbi:MAG: hypothetical protein HXS40_09175 [Theionarchaea archaeon]|nr:hypothetical protein [Theionarchaea archaeon]
MESQPRMIIGFASVCFAFAFLMGTLLLQIYTGILVFRLLVGIMMVCVIVMINGLKMMTGGKQGLSHSFGKPEPRVKIPMWLGVLLESYVVIGSIIILCVLFAVLVAHSIVQRLFVLLVGNTVVCVLLYLKFDRKGPTDSH